MQLIHEFKEMITYPFDDETIGYLEQKLLSPFVLKTVGKNFQNR